MTQGGLADVGSSVLAVAGRSDKFVDDLTGQPLPPDLCREARRVEILYFRDKESGISGLFRRHSGSQAGSLSPSDWWR